MTTKAEYATYNNTMWEAYQEVVKASSKRGHTEAMGVLVDRMYQVMDALVMEKINAKG